MHAHFALDLLDTNFCSAIVCYPCPSNRDCIPRFYTCPVGIGYRNMVCEHCPAAVLLGEPLHVARWLIHLPHHP